MEATLIVIDSDDELARARAMVDRLMASDKPEDLARLAAQARLIAAYEEEKWPPRTSSAAAAIRYLWISTGWSAPISSRCWAAPSASTTSCAGGGN